MQNTKDIRAVIKEMIAVATGGDDGDPIPEWTAGNRDQIDQWQARISSALEKLE